MYGGYFFSFSFLFTDMLSADVYRTQTHSSVHSISLSLRSAVWTVECMAEMKE